MAVNKSFFTPCKFYFAKLTTKSCFYWFKLPFYGTNIRFLKQPESASFLLLALLKLLPLPPS